jgi:hypothetical protein
MDQSNLTEILARHVKWQRHEEGGERADLHGANLHWADLREADLDFSCLPLRCGGLHWKIDSRIARQLAYHFCSMECDDLEFVETRTMLLPFANKFHRVKECGFLE